ncbi:glycosyltransferase [uncultured Formosa sp.]|uniref:glycosyltransferase n=1 Tax=uncultured Formosa sp. TaxID=255435 RepID=UPI0026152C3E|nr:glycosyltransferase [uncultured Formosa sp.]
MKNTKPNISILSITLGSGGAEKVISLFLKKLKEDYNVTLVLFYNHIHFTIPEGINVVCLSNESPARPFYSKFLDLVRFKKKYSAFLKKENINISVSFLAFPNLLNGMIASTNKHIKTIISERGFPSDNTSSKLSLYISKIFYPIFYNKCSKLFSNSVYINQDLKDNFGVKIPMDVIYNPIELPQETINPETLNQNFKSLKIITAGTLNKRKNHIMIIRALQNTANQYNLTILGGGPLETYLTKEIADLNLEHKITLGGKVKNVNDYLLANHCFVLSSFTEGFPNALIEAMAIGLPCISTNCLSGPLELLNENKAINIKTGAFYKGKYGLLINNDDHKGLKEALAYFNDNPQERENYSKLSLQRAKEYKLESIYSTFNKFLKN